jgi:glycosyltransferase involved in cell wall biosynthesis
MNMPKVSVIIPTYNGANLIGDAVRSVLGQTYSNFELLIVNDASPDNTTEIIGEFNDPRIRCLVHETNQGVDRARCTGIRASTGAIIAFLDHDDFFHPDKLRAHVSFLQQHHEVDFTYNARFELNYSSRTIREIWRPPQDLTLSDLVLWFPIAPSDWVLRREWAFRLLDLMSTSHRWTGGEIVYLGNLFMAGCKFGLINRALNYRRHHSGRVFKDLSGGCEFELAAQEEIFNDPRCPAEVLAQRNMARANLYMIWAYRAFMESETSLGQDYVCEAIHSKPSILVGQPCELLNSLLINCSDDENLDHSALLKKVLVQLPHEAAPLLEQHEWAVARGYLLKGARAVMWDRLEDAQVFFRQAEELGAEIDESFVSHLTQNLLDYETEFGDLPARKVLKAYMDFLEDLGGARSSQRLRSLFAMNRAFQSYRNGEYAKVPGRVLQSVAINPRFIANRGLLVILLRSILSALPKQSELLRKTEGATLL